MNTGPIVCIRKAQTAEYGKVDFDAMVRSSLEKLEKAGVSIPAGGVVFVKPNVVIVATARESITTEPRFVAALIEILLERGVDIGHLQAELDDLLARTEADLTPEDSEPQT